MDYFTKWPEVYALPNQSATTTAAKLLHEPHSEQGWSFEVQVLGEVSWREGVMKTRTTPHHPQSHCLVIRKMVQSPKMVSNWRGSGVVYWMVYWVVYWVQMPGWRRTVVLHLECCAITKTGDL